MTGDQGNITEIQTSKDAGSITQLPIFIGLFIMILYIYAPRYRGPEDENILLFNLEIDPFETTDVSDDYPEVSNPFIYDPYISDSLIHLLHFFLVTHFKVHFKTQFASQLVLILKGGCWTTWKTCCV